MTDFGAYPLPQMCEDCGIKLLTDARESRGGIVARYCGHTKAKTACIAILSDLDDTPYIARWVMHAPVEPEQYVDLVQRIAASYGVTAELITDGGRVH